MSGIIRILLADDHVLLRNGLGLLLQQEGYAVVGGADNGEQALEQVELLQPDIVFMDISMPVLNGLEATRKIVSRYSYIKVIILTVHEAEEYIYRIFDSGASGCLFKKTAHQYINDAIRTVHAGDVFITPTVHQGLIDHFRSMKKKNMTATPANILTKRELEVLQLIAQGHSFARIGEVLNISQRTVETHKLHISKKLGRNSIQELVRYAITNRLSSWE